MLPEEKEYDPIGVLGIDLGIENIAVDSDREIFDCKKIENTSVTIIFLCMITSNKRLSLEFQTKIKMNPKVFKLLSFLG